MTNKTLEATPRVGLHENQSAGDPVPIPAIIGYWPMAEDALRMDCLSLVQGKAYYFARPLDSLGTEVANG